MVFTHNVLFIYNTFFIQLLRGSSENELRQYNLNRDPSHYHYTNQGSMETLAEKSDFKATSGAFKALGFSSDEIISIWKIVAAVLHLGNITFKSICSCFSIL